MWKLLPSYCLRNGGFVVAKGTRCDRFIFSTASFCCDWSSGRVNENNELSNSSTNLRQDSISRSVLSLKNTNLTKSFSRTEEILNFLDMNPNLEAGQFAPIFSNIFKLQKNGFSNISDDELTKNPHFEKLCIDVKKNVRQLNVTELIDIFKTLSLLKVSSNSLLSQNLLQMISKNVNKLTIQQIIFLNYILKQCSTSPLVEALRIATPVVFEAIIHTIERENPNRVYNAFIFAFTENISQKTRDFLVNTALQICDKFSTLQAQRMSAALCKLNQTSPELITLYKYLMDHVSDFMENQLTFSDINYLLNACINAFIHKNELYFHEKFLEKTVEYAIDQQLSILQVGSLLKNFSRVSYPCYKLLDYLDEKLVRVSDFEKIESPTPFISFLTCCSNCSYKPKFWNMYQERFVALIDKQKMTPLPLLRVVCDLVVMKCWVSSLIEHCFREEFLRDYLKRSNSMIDYLTLLRLYQAVQTIYPGGYKHPLPPANFIEEAVRLEYKRTDFPLEGALSYVVGGWKYILSGVGTRYGHFIDHVIVKRKSGNMAIINETELKGNSGKMVESLEIPHESLIIGILLLTPASYCIDGIKIRGIVQLKIHSLEALGIAVIPVSKLGFMSLPEHERIPYLAKKIENRTFVCNLKKMDATLVQLDQ